MFTNFIEDDQTIEQYCANMRKNGVWGGHIELKAMAHVFNFNVVIHKLEEKQLRREIPTLLEGSCHPAPPS